MSSLLYFFFHPRFRYVIVHLAMLMILSGFIAGKAWISAGMITLAAHALLQKNILVYCKSIIKEPVFLGSTAIVFIYIISGLWSTDTGYWLGRTTNKLPFLLLPFIMPLLTSTMRKKDVLLWIYFSLLIVMIGVIYSTTVYMQNFYSITDSYRMAKVIPTLLSHVRFSLWIALSVLYCVHAYLHNLYIYHEVEKKILLLIGILFFIFLHVLAVRSGLIGCYITLLFYFYFYFKNQNKIGYYFATILFFISFGILAFLLLPSLQNKVRYVDYDFELFHKKSDIANTSDGKRIITYRAAFELIKKNPILGVGIGDLKDKVFEEAQILYPDTIKEKIEPHNQFLWIMTSMGLIGLLIFIIGLYLPFIKLNYFQDLLLLGFLLLMSLSFMVEATLETQHGITLFSIFYLYFRLLNKYLTQP